MKRRSFLQLLGLAPIAATLRPMKSKPCEPVPSPSPEVVRPDPADFTHDDIVEWSINRDYEDYENPITGNKQRMILNGWSGSFRSSKALPMGQEINLSFARPGGTVDGRVVITEIHMTQGWGRMDYIYHFVGQGPLTVS